MINNQESENAVRILSKVSTFDDVQKSLQEIEKALNDLTISVSNKAETEVSDEEGKTGDIQITQNKDKSYTFEIRTEEGWKTPVIGDSAVKFKSKPAFKDQDKSIDEIETNDTTTGDKLAEQTIYDEKANKFVIARPDFDSGWIRYIWTDNNVDADPALSIAHTLGVLPTMIVAYLAPDQGSGNNGDSVDSSEITYFTQMSGHHIGSSSADQARYGMAFKVTADAVLFTSGDASAGYWSSFNTGSAASASNLNGSHSIRYLLWK